MWWYTITWGLCDNLGFPYLSYLYKENFFGENFVWIYFRKLRQGAKEFSFIWLHKYERIQLLLFFRNNCRGVISDNFPRFNQFKHVIPSGAFCRQRFCQFARRNWILGRIRYGIISRSFQRDHLHNQPVDFNYSCCQQHNLCPGHSWIPGEIMRGT